MLFYILRCQVGVKYNFLRIQQEGRMQIAYGLNNTFRAFKRFPVAEEAGLTFV